LYDAQSTIPYRESIHTGIDEVQMRIGVIYNPGSGRKGGGRILRALTDHIACLGLEPLVIDVSHFPCVEAGVHRFVQTIDAIAVVGGDGTLNGAVNGLLSSDRPDIPLAFVPAGRGKDTARSIPSLTIDTLRAGSINWASRRTVDVGVATLADGDARYFINVSNIGLSSGAAQRVSRMPRVLGAFAYTLGAVQAFRTTKPCTVCITLDDDETLELDDVLTVAICNGRAFGGGIYIAPDADVADGILQLVTVRHANVMDLVKNLPKLRSGAPFEHPALSRWNGRSIKIEHPELTPMDIDGELWGAGTVTWSVVPSALNWIGPRT
jgi:diacylglycerol kinase (ATP)